MAVEGYKSNKIDESLNSWDKVFVALPKDMQEDFLAMPKSEQEVLKMTVLSDMRQVNNMSIKEVEDELWKQTFEAMSEEDQREFNEMDEDEQSYHKLVFFEEVRQQVNKSKKK